MDRQDGLRAADRTAATAQAQAEVVKAAKDMYASGLVAGTWGNISARIDGEYMAITPSGMEYESLRADQMVVVKMDTLEYEGALKPSIEAVVHAAIYRDRPEVNGIVHTHSTYALTVASARKEIPPICEDQVQILGGSIRVSDYVMPGTKELADACVAALRGRNGALIANHGAISCDVTLRKALTGAAIIEKAAQVYLLSMLLGGAKELPQGDVDFFSDFFRNHYGQRV